MLAFFGAMGNRHEVCESVILCGFYCCCKRANKTDPSARLAGSNLTVCLDYRVARGCQALAGRLAD